MPSVLISKTLNDIIISPLMMLTCMEKEEIKAYLKVFSKTISYGDQFFLVVHVHYGVGIPCSFTKESIIVSFLAFSWSPRPTMIFLQVCINHGKGEVESMPQSIRNSYELFMLIYHSDSVEIPSFLSDTSYKVPPVFFCNAIRIL